VTTEQSAEPFDVAVVSYFNPLDLLGGAERIAWAEAELLSAGSRVAFLSASPGADSASFAQYRLGGWTRALYQRDGEKRNPFVLALFHLLSLFNPAVFLESRALFRRLRPSVVHTHNLFALSPAVWLAARSSGARVVHTHHDLWLLCERATMTDASGRPCLESRGTCLLCRALRAPKKAQLACVTVEIFPSTWLRARLGRSGSIVRSFAIEHPAESSAEVDSPTPPVVGYVGALTPHKLGALLEAFALISAGPGQAIRLAIAGSGPLAGDVVRAAKANPHIDYLGQIDAQARGRLLAELSVLVIPSTCAETSPLVFFEALSAGVPVVASNLGGITELAQFENLVLVPAGDAHALARSLKSLLADRTEWAKLRAGAGRHKNEATSARFIRDLTAVLEAPDASRSVSKSPSAPKSR
jgi:glycosyltransferase involved in cell wall biosynthesis